MSARLEQCAVFLLRQRCQFDGDVGELLFQFPDHRDQIFHGAGLRIFSCDDEDIVHSPFLEDGRFREGLFDRESAAREVVAVAESAVDAVVHAEIGKVDRCIESRDPSEMAETEFLSPFPQAGQFVCGKRGKKAEEVPERGFFRRQGPLEVGRSGRVDAVEQGLLVIFDFWIHDTLTPCKKHFL